MRHHHVATAGPHRAGTMSRKTKVHQLGDGGRKCDAKLRVIANGDIEVNVVRAERCDALSVATTYRIEQRGYSMERVEAVEAARLESTDPLGRHAKPARPPPVGRSRPSRPTSTPTSSSRSTAPSPCPGRSKWKRRREWGLCLRPRCRSRSSRSSRPIRSCAMWP